MSKTNKHKASSIGILHRLGDARKLRTLILSDEKI